MPFSEWKEEKSKATNLEHLGAELGWGVSDDHTSVFQGLDLVISTSFSTGNDGTSVTCCFGVEKERGKLMKNEGRKKKKARR